MGEAKGRGKDDRTRNEGTGEKHTLVHGTHKINKQKCHLKEGKSYRLSLLEEQCNWRELVNGH